MSAPHSLYPCVHKEKGNAGLAAQLSLHKGLWVCCTMKECWTPLAAAVYSRLYVVGVNPPLRSSTCRLLSLSLPINPLPTGTVHPCQMLTSVQFCCDRMVIAGALPHRWRVFMSEGNAGRIQRGKWVGVRSHKITMRPGDGSHFPLTLHQLLLLTEERHLTFSTAFYLHSNFHLFLNHC